MHPGVSAPGSLFLQQDQDSLASTEVPRIFAGFGGVNLSSELWAWGGVAAPGVGVLVLHPEFAAEKAAGPSRQVPLLTSSGVTINGPRQLLRWGKGPT